MHRDQPVVAVCGDGGFAMTMNGLMTALEHDIPIVVIVFNNNALGWVLNGSGPFAAEFQGFRPRRNRPCMGCRGQRQSKTRRRSRLPCRKRWRHGFRP